MSAAPSTTHLLELAKQFNARRRWNRPGKIPLEPLMVNSPSVKQIIDGLIKMGKSRQDAEDALMRMHNLGDILTPEELAQRLKVPVSWVYDKQRTRCKNPLPSIPMGRYVRFDWDQVVKWLEDQADRANRSTNSSASKNGRKKRG